MTSLKVKFAAVLAATALLGGCESNADQRAKAAVVEGLVDAAVKTCDLQGDESARYRSRLSEALMQARSRNLATLRARDVTVCLDRRLQHQNTEYFDNTALGFLYGDTRILTLWDNGRDLNQDSIFARQTAAHYSDDITSAAAYVLHDGVTTPVMMVYHGPNEAWRGLILKIQNAADVRSTYLKTPALHKPPLKAF